MLHSDGTKYCDGLIPQGNRLPQLPAIVMARVDEVLFTDDPRNSTFNRETKEIEYHCTIVSGLYDGTKIFHVKDTVDVGAQYNKSGVVRTPVTKGKMEAPIDKPQKTNGEFVLLAFINGNTFGARIIRAIPHPLGNALNIKKSDGASSFFEYNGMFIGIDKDGALSISFGGGPKDKEGNATNSSAAGSKITITKAGVINLEDNKGQKIQLDTENQKLIISATQDLEMEAGSNWAIEVNANASIKAGGTLELEGAICQIQGAGNLAARVGDLVVGTDSRGDTVTATVQTGSSTTLIGG